MPITVQTDVSSHKVSGSQPVSGSTQISLTGNNHDAAQVVLHAGILLQ